MFLVHLEQTNSCKFSTDHTELHSLHLWNFVGFCKNLLELIYSKLKKTTEQKYQIFLSINIDIVNLSQWSIRVEKKMWVSLSVPSSSYLCSVWYRECCQDLWTDRGAVKEVLSDMILIEELFLGVYIQESVKPS